MYMLTLSFILYVTSDTPYYTIDTTHTAQQPKIREEKNRWREYHLLDFHFVALLPCREKSTISASNKKMEATLAMARAMPKATPSAITKAVDAIHGTSDSKKTKTPSCTVPGPSHKQALVEFSQEAGGPPWVLFPTMIVDVNQALERARSQTRLISGTDAYEGWAFQTSHVLSEQALNLLRSLICARYPDHAQSVWVGLPQSTSFMKIVGVPMF